jgi:hypothetical protein
VSDGRLPNQRQLLPVETTELGKVASKLFEWTSKLVLRLTLGGDRGQFPLGFVAEGGNR